MYPSNFTYPPRGSSRPKTTSARPETGGSPRRKGGLPEGPALRPGGRRRRTRTGEGPRGWPRPPVPAAVTRAAWATTQSTANVMAQNLERTGELRPRFRWRRRRRRRISAFGTAHGVLRGVAAGGLSTRTGYCPRTSGGHQPRPDHTNGGSPWLSRSGGVVSAGVAASVGAGAAAVGAESILGSSAPAAPPGHEPATPAAPADVRTSPPSPMRWRPTGSSTAPCQFCNCNCRLKVRLRAGRVVDITGETADPVQAGGLCVKGPMMTQLAYNRLRLTTPLKRVGGAKGSPDVEVRAGVVGRGAGDHRPEDAGAAGRGAGAHDREQDVGPDAAGGRGRWSAGCSRCSAARTTRTSARSATTPAGTRWRGRSGLGNFTNGYGVDPGHRA